MSIYIYRCFYWNFVLILLFQEILDVYLFLISFIKVKLPNYFTWRVEFLSGRWRRITWNILWILNITKNLFYLLFKNCLLEQGIEMDWMTKNTWPCSYYYIIHKIISIKYFTFLGYCSNLINNFLENHFCQCLVEVFIIYGSFSNIFKYFHLICTQYCILLTF